MRARSVAGVWVTAAVTVATSTSCASEEMSCAQVVSHSEPVLNIREATGPDGKSVGTVEVTLLRLDGRSSLADEKRGFEHGDEWTPGQSSRSDDLYWNVRLSRGRLLCDVPCGFGTFHGADAELEVVSDGAQGAWRGPVGYTSVEGDRSSEGCGSSRDEGVDVELELTRDQ